MSAFVTKMNRDKTLLVIYQRFLQNGTGIEVIDDLQINNFHISLYELALLGTIFIGLTFIVLLWFHSTHDQRSTINPAFADKRSSVIGQRSTVTSPWPFLPSSYG